MTGSLGKERGGGGGEGGGGGGGEEEKMRDQIGKKKSPCAYIFPP